MAPKNHKIRIKTQYLPNFEPSINPPEMTNFLFFLHFYDFVINSTGNLPNTASRKENENLALPILGPFGPNLDLFWSNISLKLYSDLRLDVSIVIVYIF